MTNKKILEEITEQLKNGKRLGATINSRIGIIKDLGSKLHEDGEMKSFFQKLDDDIKNIFPALDVLVLENVSAEELDNYETEVENIKKAFEALREDKIRLEKDKYPEEIPKEIAEAYLDRIDIVLVGAKLTLEGIVKALVPKT